MGRKTNELAPPSSYEEFEERIKGGFASRVRRLRERMGIGVRGLGERVGVSGSMISNYETEKGLPSLDTLLRLAWELGVSPEALLGSEAGASLHTSGSGRTESLKLLGDRLTDSQIRFLSHIPADRLRDLVDVLRRLAASPELSGASVIADSPPPRRRRRR